MACIPQGFVSSMMKTGFCPNYFIPSVNLWGEQILGQWAEEVPCQALHGCEIIERTIKSGISLTLIPDIFRCEMLLQKIFSLPPCQFYPLTTLLLVLTEVLVVPSLPVLVLAIIVTLQTIVSWALGMITCLPVVLVYSCILLATRHLLHRF